MDQRACQDQWAEICFILKAPVTNAEGAFQLQVVRAIEKLGWNQYQGEIQTQPPLQIGRDGTIRPDVVIYSPELNPLIAIEVKRPSERIDNPGFKGQLRSYMRQMKADFGLLIGSEIRVFYDGKSSPVQHEPFLLERIQFDKESEGGCKFVEVFSRNNFLSKQYTFYVDEKIRRFQRDQEIKKLRGVLRSNEIKLRLIEFLEKEFAAYGEDIFEEAMKELVIEIRVTPTAHPDTDERIENYQKKTGQAEEGKVVEEERDFRPGSSARDIVDTIKSAGVKGIDLKTLLDEVLKHDWAPRSTNPEGRVQRIVLYLVRIGSAKLVDGKCIYIGGTPDAENGPVTDAVVNTSLNDALAGKISIEGRAPLAPSRSPVYTKKKPGSCTFFGETYHPKSWIELLLIVAAELHRRHTGEFGKCLDLRGSKRTYFSTDPRDLVDPKRIADSKYYATAKLGTPAIFQVIRKLMDLFGYKDTDYHIDAQ